MQNINLIFLVQPVSIILLSVGLIVYWRLKRRFKSIVFFYTLIAYAVAIVLKDVLQFFTASAVTSAFGFQSVVTGLYYGLQTSFFEIGLAYLVALYFVKIKRLDAGDAEAYGLGLSFWENAILLGILPLINIVTYYGILSTNTQLASTLFNQLTVAQPALFYSTLQALPLVGFGILERISSLLLHFSWGYLVVFSAFYRKKKYFLIALPMGLVDALVVYSQALTLPVFEGIVFGISLIAILVALLSTRNERKQDKPDAVPVA